MKKVFLPLVLASAFIGLGTVHAEELEYISPIDPRIAVGTKGIVCIGSNESINSADEAEDICKFMGTKGYNTYLFTRPNYSDLTTLPASLTASLSFNNILFFAGHGDTFRMHWGDNRTGNYKTGVTMISNDTYGGYKYVMANSFPNVDLAVYMGCNTAKSDDMNLAKYGNSKGQRTTVGWREEIDTSDTDEWSSKFFLNLAYGLTVQESIDASNRGNYRTDAIKTARLYGTNGTIKLSSDIISSISNNNTNNSMLEEKNVELKDNAKIDKNSAVEYIRENFDYDFNLDNYIAAETINDNNIIYTYTLKVNDIRTNLGYTIIKYNNSNIINLTNNMQNKTLSELKNNLEKYKYDAINEDELILKALNKYTSDSQTNTIISYNSSQKYYDAKKDILYFDVHLNSYDNTTNTKEIITESYKI